jgi:hypothetical protein
VCAAPEDAPPDAAALATLTDWLEQAIVADQQDAIEQLVASTPPASSARQRLRHLVQAQAGRQCLVGTRSGVLHLFGIPLFLELASAAPAAAVLGPLECAFEVARTLEDAMELPAHSLTLSQYASEVNRAYNLSAHAWRIRARDVGAGDERAWRGDAQLGVGPRPGALWLGTCLLEPRAEADGLAGFGRVNAQRPAMAAYRHRCAELLERDLAQLGVAATVHPYMPVLLAQLFGAYRALELHAQVAEMVRPWRAQARTLAWQPHVQTLTVRVRVLDAEGAELETRRLALGDTSPAQFERLFAGVARRLGLASTAG